MVSGTAINAIFLARDDEQLVEILNILKSETRYHDISVTDYPDYLREMVEEEGEVAPLAVISAPGTSKKIVERIKRRMGWN
jgi:hypothetical protein